MSSAESAAIVHKHQTEYKSVFSDAIAAKGADGDHKPEALKKLAGELADIQKDDPAYYRTILQQLNGKFKAEDFGLQPGETLLGGVKNGNDVHLVTKSADGKSLNYYGETDAGDSKTGKTFGRTGQLDNANSGDPRGTEFQPKSAITKMRDGTGTYTEGKDDHNMWDVARHVLGYDKLDTLAKKNEAANLIKLLEKDPQNAKRIKAGQVIHLPAMSFSTLPDAPQAASKTQTDQPAVDAPLPGKLPAEEPTFGTRSIDAPQPSRVQLDDPVSDQTIEDLIHKKNTPGEKPVDATADTLAAKVKKDNADMTAAADAVFTEKAAAILGFNNKGQIAFGSPNTLDDFADMARAYSKAHPNDLDAQNLVKGMQYMKDNWSKFEVTGMSSSPYLDAASFKRLMEKRTANLAELERLSKP